LIGSPWHDSPERYPSNTVVLHNLPHAAVMAAWRRSALGLMPSVFPDPCPTVALEAMATGIPLIASRIGGLRDIVADGVTGILVRPGDHDELRRAMSRFLQEPDLGNELGHAGRARAPLFMASTVIERLEKIYSATAA
jgi:glycosyltransferase involved in cell wall biosynthesis